MIINVSLIFFSTHQMTPLRKKIIWASILTIWVYFFLLQETAFLSKTYKCYLRFKKKNSIQLSIQLSSWKTVTAQIEIMKTIYLILLCTAHSYWGWKNIHSFALLLGKSTPDDLGPLQRSRLLSWLLLVFTTNSWLFCSWV